MRDTDTVDIRRWADVDDLIFGSSDEACVSDR